LKKVKKPVLQDGYYWAKITSHTMSYIEADDEIVGRYSIIEIRDNSKYVTLFETDQYRKRRTFTYKYFLTRCVCEDILPIPNPNEAVVK